MLGRLFPIAFFIAAGVILGLWGKGHIDSLANNSNWGGKETITGNKIGRDEVSGNKVGGGNEVNRDNIGGDKVTTNGIETLNAAPGSNIYMILPGDPNFNPAKQPNIAAADLLQVKPITLDQFGRANKFTSEMLLLSYSRYAEFSNEKISILDRLYETVFRLQGSDTEHKTVFALNGSQKGVFLQFGLKDLADESDNLVYKVDVLLDAESGLKTVWSGRLVYGSQKDQIVSLPFNAAGGKSIVIKYSILQGRSNRGLFFTRAEQLYE